jgi:uncharacterized protein
MKRLFLLLLLIAGYELHAQNRAVDSVLAERNNIKVVSRFRNGAVELRWYPVNKGTWRKSIHTGYIIKRVELGDDANAEFRQLAIVKPYTNAEWQQKTNMQDNLVKTVIESIADPKPVAGQHAADRDNEEEAMFFSYVLSTSLSADAAKGAGLVYADNTIEAGKKYAYEISITGKKPDPKDATMIIIEDTRTPYQSAIPAGLETEEGEGTVKLKWNNTSNQNYFVGYYIQRSQDGGKTFTSLNKFPFISVAEQTDELEYTDSVKNYIPYQYRIVGITPWVDQSTPSEVVAAMGRDKTAASPPTNTRAKGDRNKIMVSWDLPVSSRDLAGFRVARSTKLEGPFSSISGDKLVPVSQKMFVDEKPVPGEPYYAVYAVDTAGNYSSTFSVMANVYDSVGPKRPLAVTGNIDSNGVVRINWKAGNDNDLVGYHVYMANGKENVYRQITGVSVKDTMFTDTVSMKSLTREVYYKVTAIDYNNNASPYSETLVLQRPDVIAPSIPVIRSYSVVGNKVKLEFTPSNSSDVRMHQLFRQDAAGKKVKLADINKAKSFTDSLVNAGENYIYTLVATDASGLSKSSRPLNIAVLENETMEGVADLSGRASDKNIVLQWRGVDSKEQYSLVLFRAVNDGELQWYKKIPGSAKSYSETADAGKYQYAIKVLYGNGAESELSKAVTIETK